MLLRPNFTEKFQKLSGKFQELYDEAMTQRFNSEYWLLSASTGGENNIGPYFVEKFRESYLGLLK